jgi:hypothetical protein
MNILTHYLVEKPAFEFELRTFMNSLCLSNFIKF